MQLSQADVVEILRIVDSCGIGELRLEIGELRLHVVKGGVATAPSAVNLAPISQSAQSAQSAKAVQTPPAAQHTEAEPGTDSGLIEVTAPMVGTFYRAPSPGATPFVQPGQQVDVGTPVGIVEVMKLMNTVNAGVAGTVREVVADDAQMVEYGQVLVRIEEAARA